MSDRVTLADIAEVFASNETTEVRMDLDKRDLIVTLTFGQSLDAVEVVTALQQLQDEIQVRSFAARYDISDEALRRFLDSKRGA